MQFKDLHLNKPILRAISEQNYDVPTPVLLQTIPFVLAKKDIIASAQTGTGKPQLLLYQYCNYFLTNKIQVKK